jgi:centrosomal protein CEP104
MATAESLGFCVATASGEDAGFPAGALNTRSPHSRGWVTPKFGSFPQQVVLRLSATSNVQQLEILSHQSLVATRLDLYIGNAVRGQPDVAEAASYRSIGYLCLDSNERSNFGARELKKVPLCNVVGNYLRIVVQAPHRNAHNLYNQVGIVAVSMLGQAVHGRAQMRVPAPINTGGLGARNVMDELAHMMTMDPATAHAIRRVIDAKQQLVAREEFPLAKVFKQHEQELSRLGLPIAKLEQAKRNHIAIEDYDLAKQAQQQLRGLRASFHALLAKIDFEGAAAVCAAQPMTMTMGSIFELGGYQRSPAAASHAAAVPHMTPSSSPIHAGAAAIDGPYSASSSIDEQPAVAGALPTNVEPRRMPFGSPAPTTEKANRELRPQFNLTPTQNYTPMKGNLEDLPIGGMSWGVTSSGGGR